MSTSRIERAFKCHNDCRQTGCPGHSIRLEYHHTSDTVSIFVDDKHTNTFDKNKWRALVNMDRELRDN
jgi:hypothetical protein